MAFFEEREKITSQFTYTFICYSLCTSLDKIPVKFLPPECWVPDPVSPGNSTENSIVESRNKSKLDEDKSFLGQKSPNIKTLLQVSSKFKNPKIKINTVV